MSNDGEMRRRLDLLEHKVAELEDERAIRELLARYGYNADSPARREAFVQLFTEDGVQDVDRPSGEIEVFTGHDEITGMVENAVTNVGFHGRAMHVEGINVVVHVTGDEAVADSYTMRLKDDGGVLGMHLAGNVQWGLRKVDGRWMVHERRRRTIGHAQYTQNIDATPT